MDYELIDAMSALRNEINQLREDLGEQRMWFKRQNEMQEQQIQLLAEQNEQLRALVEMQKVQLSALYVVLKKMPAERVQGYSVQVKGEREIIEKLEQSSKSDKQQEERQFY